MIDGEKNFWRAALFIFALVLGQPAFSTDVMTYGHDILFHTFRIEGMAESMSGGQFPVRIVGKSLAGYGEASGIFYPNLFFYIPALLRMAGVPLVAAYNFFCILINVATIFFTFWSVERLLKSTRTAAVIAMIYGGFMYRLIDLYVRSALGEAIAMAFMPLALISLWLMLNRSEKYWRATVIGFTGVLQAHILSSLFMLGAALVIVLSSIRRLSRREILMSTAKAAGFIALLNLWFYVPFIDLYSTMSFNMQDELRSSDILSSSSLPWKLFGGMQLFVGWSIVLILIAFIVRERTAIDRVWWSALAFGALMLIMSTKIFPWDMLETMPLIGERLGVLQFPYRLVMLASMTLAYCAGIALVRLLDGVKHSRWIVCLICFAIAQYNFAFLNDSEGKTPEINGYPCNWFIDHNDGLFRLCFVESDAFGYIDYVYSDIKFDDLIEGFAPEDFLDNLKKPTKLRNDDLDPRGAVIDWRKVGMTIELNVRADEPTTIRLPLFHFDGYEATTDDGRSLTVGSIGKHRLTVEVPKGETHVRVEYVGRSAWRIALMASVIGLIGFVIQWRRERSC